MDFLKKLLDISPKIKKFLITATILGITIESIKIVPPYIYKNILDKLIESNNASLFDTIILTIVTYLVVLIIMSIIENLSEDFLIHRNISNTEDIKMNVFNKFIDTDYNIFETTKTGENIGKITTGISRVFQLMDYLTESFIPTVIQAIVTLVFFSYYNPVLTVPYILFIPIYLFTLVFFNNKVEKYRKMYHKQDGKINGFIGETFVNIKTVKDFGNENYQKNKLSDLIISYKKILFDKLKLDNISSIVREFLITTARVATLIICIYMFSRNEISAGSIVLVMTLSEKAFSNLYKLGKLIYRIHDNKTYVEDFDNILSFENKVIDKIRSKKIITNGSITFQNTSFKYDTSKKDALKNISFEIQAKEVVALVGRSGSGKSTITKLLLRHYDTTEGNILIDGTDIKDYSITNLRKNIAIVSQDVELFHESIRYNITYGKPEASEKEIHEAAKKAYIHDFIMELENGYDTVVGEKGVKLSGGQKQRIAIARAIIKNPKILIFDEATSSLDSESEKYIHESIKKLSGKLTLIIIAHRFATIKDVDKIIVLEKGGLKEIGTHQELIKQKGIFATLRNLQKLGEIE